MENNLGLMKRNQNGSNKMNIVVIIKLKYSTPMLFLILRK